LSSFEKKEDPDTWPNRKVPVASDKATIGRDKQVILDINPPPLRERKP